MFKRIKKVHTLLSYWASQSHLRNKESSCRKECNKAEGPCQSSSLSTWSRS